MTVEEYLTAPFNDFTIKQNALKKAALSPAKLKMSRFRAVDLSEIYEDYMDDDVFVDSVEYALSTLYYIMSATVSGGTSSEKRGNREVKKGGYALTTRDREAFRAEADNIRRLLGLEALAPATDSGGLCDGSIYIKRPPRNYRVL